MPTKNGNYDENKSPVKITKSYKWDTLPKLWRCKVRGTQKPNHQWDACGTNGDDRLGKRNRLPIYYLMTFIEGSDDLYLMLEWTLDDRETEHKAMFETIAQSFKSSSLGAFYTLKRKCITSPSWTIFLPFPPSFPASRTFASLAKGNVIVVFLLRHPDKALFKIAMDNARSLGGPVAPPEWSRARTSFTPWQWNRFVTLIGCKRLEIALGPGSSSPMSSKQLALFKSFWFGDVGFPVATANTSTSAFSLATAAFTRST